MADARFKAVLDDLWALHQRKSADYGMAGDPFVNVRASSVWGIPPHVGALVRANDKIVRLQRHARDGTLACEGVEDSLMDLAAYAIISLVLYRESLTVRPQKKFVRCEKIIAGEQCGMEAGHEGQCVWLRGD